MLWLEKAEHWMRDKLDRRSDAGETALVPYEELLDEVTRRQREASAGDFVQLASYRILVSLDRLRCAGLDEDRTALALALQLRRDVNARLGVDKACEYTWSVDVADGDPTDGLYQIEQAALAATRKFSRATSPAPAAPQPAVVLKALAGPAAGAESRLCKAVITIGRSKEQDFCLFDDSASRLHACLRYEDGRFIVSDAGSMNGTYVNGKRIVRVGLQTGDTIRMGQSILAFAAVENDE